MTKRMLIDDTRPEETRVVIVNGNKVEDVEFESASRKQIKGNIYLAKVMRVEPSLQAAFVDYGGNKHGFLAFGEIQKVIVAFSESFSLSSPGFSVLPHPASVPRIRRSVRRSASIFFIVHSSILILMVNRCS